PPGAGAGELLETVANQEWITVEGQDDPDSWVLRVEPHLLERLRAWFAHSEPRALDPELGARLAALIAKHGLKQLGAEKIEAATRCLDTAGALALWSSLPE